MVRPFKFSIFDYFSIPIDDNIVIVNISAIFRLVVVARRRGGGVGGGGTIALAFDTTVDTMNNYLP